MVGEEGEEDAASFPVRASVTIEKVILFFRNWKTRKLKRKRLIQDGQGAVTIDTVAQDGEIAVESVMYYKDGKLADDQSAEADWQRRGLYIGPQFAELDQVS